MPMNPNHCHSAACPVARFRRPLAATLRLRTLASLNRLRRRFRPRCAVATFNLGPLYRS